MSRHAHTDHHHPPPGPQRNARPLEHHHLSRSSHLPATHSHYSHHRHPHQPTPIHPSHHRPVQTSFASPPSKRYPPASPADHQSAILHAISRNPSAEFAFQSPDHRLQRASNHRRQLNPPDYTQRTLISRANTHHHPFEDSSRRVSVDEMAPSRRHAAYEDLARDRRSDEIISRPVRYTPYPPSAPRADTHHQSLSRTPLSGSGVSHHPSYHSHSAGPSPYEDRPFRAPEYSPQRTFDPNSQFNHGPPKDKSSPSQSAIFMGLPIHTDEANLRAFLEEAGASVESVTIIYDRLTGQSKRYGFARFTTVEAARAFVEPHFPMIVWKEPSGSRFDRSGDGLKVKIDYSQKEKVPFEPRQKDRDHLPRYPLHSPTHPDSSQPTPHHSSSNPNSSFLPRHHNLPSDPSSAPSNDGARDIGGTPTSILLLRGLDPSSTEQEIAQHLQNIPDPSQTVLPESIRKVMLIKSRATRASWGYAFVQFMDVQVAVKALSLLLNTSLFPRGFQIRSKTITVTFAHEHSFHPVYNPSDWSFQGAGGQELAYWDEKAYTAVFNSTIPTRESVQDRASRRGVETGTHSDTQRRVSSSSQSQDRSNKDAGLKDNEGDQHLENRNGISQSDPDLSDMAPAADTEHHMSHLESCDPNQAVTPQAKNSVSRDPQDADPLIKTPRLADQPSSKQNKNNQSSTAPGARDNHHQIKESIKNEKKKTNVEPIATKKMVANIQKWNSKHQEISNPAQLLSPPEDTGADKTDLNVDGSIIMGEDEYSDLNRMTCLLCQRQFKSVEDLQRHNSLSNLHKGNLQDDKLKRAAKLRKMASLKNPAKRTAPSVAPATNAAGGPEAIKKYTDRAAVRREVYGQPETPSESEQQANKKARYEPAPLPVQPPAQPDKDGIQSSNVGSKMLEKMGWQKGEGLGNGNGRVEPVIASQYVKGVGLGASTGQAIGKYDDSKKGFLEQVKDKTVQRYHDDSQMSASQQQQQPQ